MRPKVVLSVIGGALLLLVAISLKTNSGTLVNNPPQHQPQPIVSSEQNTTAPIGTVITKATASEGAEVPPGDRRLKIAVSGEFSGKTNHNQPKN